MSIDMLVERNIYGDPLAEDRFLICIQVPLIELFRLRDYAKMMERGSHVFFF